MDGDLFECGALPFGWSQSPHFFVKLLSAFVDWLKDPMGVAPDFEWSPRLARFDYRVLAYLDDFLFVSYENFSRSQALMRLLRRLFRAFAITLHPDKCDQQPRRAVDFLGFRLEATGRLALTERRFHKVRARAAGLLRSMRFSRRFLAYRDLRSFVGLAASCYAAVPFARLYVRALYGVLAEYERRYRAVPGFSPRWGLRGHRCKLPKPAEKELAFWAELAWADSVTDLVAPSGVAVLYTDASSYRWGAVLVDSSGSASNRVSGEFPEGL